MPAKDHSDRIQTLCLHAGEGPRHVGGAVSPAPEMSTNFFTHPDVVGFSANDLTDSAPHFYTRWSNPTIALLESRLAALDGGEASVCFASGMAALSALFLDCLHHGDHLVVSNVCYAGAAELAHDILPAHGVSVSAVDTSNPQAVAAAMREKTRLVHVETPANPILRLSDVAAVARIARSAGAKLSVDATLATPLGLKPLALGADYVVHSLTKYLCGHGDALGGAVIGSTADVDALRKRALIHFGGTLSPLSAWLMLRSLETLAPRMALHEANARRIEGFLAEHAAVRAVYWPGSARHPQHELARRQMRNFSGMLAFSTRAEGMVVARRLAERLRVWSYAVSLGKTKSLIYYIPTEAILQSSFHLTGDAQRAYREWTGDGTFRVSVGLEDADDLIEDLEQALRP